MPNTITIKSGQSLSQIAAANNVSVSALCKANNINNPDDIKAGQKITIPAGDNTDIKKTDAQKQSMSVVKKAQEYGYGEKYKFQVDKDGNYIITLKEETQIAKLKNELGIPTGILRQYNEEFVNNAKKPFISVHSSEYKYNDDNRYAQEGSTFKLPKGALNPKDPDDTLWNKVKSFLFD